MAAFYYYIMDMKVKSRGEKLKKNELNVLKEGM